MLSKIGDVGVELGRDAAGSLCSSKHLPSQRNTEWLNLFPGNLCLGILTNAHSLTTNAAKILTYDVVQVVRSWADQPFLVLRAKRHIVQQLSERL